MSPALPGALLLFAAAVLPLPHFQARTIATGAFSKVAISPDGSTVAYVENSCYECPVRILTRRPGAGEPTEILGAQPDLPQSLAFTSDGQSVCYSFFQTKGYDCVFTRGGPAVTMFPGAVSHGAFSPDGKTIAITSGDTLLVYPLPPQSGKYVASFPKLGFSPIAMAWSPDGTRIALASFFSDPNVFIADLRSHTVRSLLKKSWGTYISGIDWLDDQRVVFASTPNVQGLSQLWTIDVDSGSIDKLTDGGRTAYESFAISRKSGRIAALATTAETQLWLWTRSGGVRTIIPVFGSAGSHVAVLADKRIVYEDPDLNFRSVRSDGTDDRPLLKPPRAFKVTALRASVDRNALTWTQWSENNKAENLWMWSVGETEPHTVPSVPAKSHAILDGSMIIDDEGGKLQRKPVTGGEARTISDYLSEPAVSPNGRMIAGYRAKKLVVLSYPDGAVLHTYERRTLPMMSGVAWTADSKALVYEESLREGSNLWRQDLSGSAPEKLTNFSDGTISSFDVSPDGSFIAFSRVPNVSNLVLLEPATAP